MLEFLKFVAGWLVLMLIIGAIALITPLIAPKIEQLFKSMKGKKEFKNPYIFSDELRESENNESTEKE